MGTGRAHDTSIDILMVLARHQRLAKDKMCTARPCNRCLSAHQQRVTQFISRRTPVDFALPAFPGKSPNKSKVIGPEPDMAEQLSLDFLRKLCEQIQDIYAPGARIIICSDGHVFSDLVHIADTDITSYQTKLTAMIASAGQGPLYLFGLDSQYPGHTYDMMRVSRLYATKLGRRVLIRVGA